MIRLLPAILALLLALPVRAGFDLVGVLPTSATELFKGQSQANDWARDKAVNKLWMEARRSAGRSLDAVTSNENIRNAVGEDLDTVGAKCFAWTKVAEYFKEAGTRITAAAMSKKKSTPPWLSYAVTKSREKAEQYCNDKGDGKGGFRRENLGKRYLWEEQNERDSQQQRAELLEQDLRIMGLIVQGMDWLGAAATTATSVGAAVTVPLMTDPEALGSPLRPADGI